VNLHVFETNITKAKKYNLVNLVQIRGHKENGIRKGQYILIIYNYLFDFFIQLSTAYLQSHSSNRNSPKHDGVLLEQVGKAINCHSSDFVT